MGLLHVNNIASLCGFSNIQEATFINKAQNSPTTFSEDLLFISIKLKNGKEIKIPALPISPDKSGNFPETLDLKKFFVIKLGRKAYYQVEKDDFSTKFSLTDKAKSQLNAAIDSHQRNEMKQIMRKIIRAHQKAAVHVKETPSASSKQDQKPRVNYIKPLLLTALLGGGGALAICKTISSYLPKDMPLRNDTNATNSSLISTNGPNASDFALNVSTSLNATAGLNSSFANASALYVPPVYPSQVHTPDPLTTFPGVSTSSINTSTGVNASYFNTSNYTAPQINPSQANASLGLPVPAEVDAFNAEVCAGTLNEPAYAKPNALPADIPAKFDQSLLSAAKANQAVLFALNASNGSPASNICLKEKETPSTELDVTAGKAIVEVPAPSLQDETTPETASNICLKEKETPSTELDVTAGKAIVEVPSPSLKDEETPETASNICLKNICLKDETTPSTELDAASGTEIVKVPSSNSFGYDVIHLGRKEEVTASASKVDDVANALISFSDLNPSNDSKPSEFLDFFGNLPAAASDDPVIGNAATLHPIAEEAVQQHISSEVNAPDAAKTAEVLQQNIPFEVYAFNASKTEEEKPPLKQVSVPGKSPTLVGGPTPFRMYRNGSAT